MFDCQKTFAEGILIFKGRVAKKSTVNISIFVIYEFFSQVLNDLSDSQQLYLDPPIERPKLKKVLVKFWAEDPYGKREIFLDGKKVVYAVPGIHCSHHVRVIVTSRPKPSMYRNETCLISADSSGGGGGVVLPYKSNGGYRRKF